MLGTKRKFMKLNDDGCSHLLLSVTSEKDVKVILEAHMNDSPLGRLMTGWNRIVSQRPDAPRTN